MLTKRGFFLLLFTFITQISLFSDQEGPIEPYTVVSSDSRYIFVMLWEGSHRYPRALDKEFEKKYPQSGLYLNDSSGTLLWPVECSRAQFILPSDGIHLIRLGQEVPWPWAARNYDYEFEAISFFKYGKLIRTYKINELMFLPYLLDRAWSHGLWKCKISIEKDNILNVSTRQGNKYTFDITTGEMVSSHQFLKSTLIVLMILFSIFYLLYLYFKIKKKRGKVLKILKSSIIKVSIASLTLTIMTFLLLELYIKRVGIDYICHISQPEMLLFMFTLFINYLPLDIPIMIVDKHSWICFSYLRQILFVSMMWFIIFALLQILNILIINLLRIIKTFFTKQKSY